MFTVDFTKRVLGLEPTRNLEEHRVTQTLRGEMSDFIGAIIAGHLATGDELHIILDGKNLGPVNLIGCWRITAAGLMEEDAQRGGFNTLKELKSALKRAGYRFKPITDYAFYKVQFSWS
jgi:hypothetical protein